MTASRELDGVGPALRKLTPGNGAEVRQRLNCGTDTSGRRRYYIFINHHQPNAFPAPLAVRSKSHDASAA